MYTNLHAQDKLPYHQIPEYPESYTAGAVAARMIDGLGFRYYWATEGLRPNDLNYKPSESGRMTKETIDHIYGLSRVVVNAATKAVNDRTLPKEPELDFDEKRKKDIT